MKNDPLKLVFATNNRHKLREIKHILGDSFTLLSMSDLNIMDDIPEDEPTLEGNALHKAKYIRKILDMNVFADDTGLEVDVLNGLPGVNSARFAGDSKDSNANIEKLLSLMGNTGNRKARFRTVIALILDNTEHLFEGTVEGTIIKEKRGTDGFGYDPIFVPEGGKRTFAEMPLDEKSLISHRARAFEKLKQFLLQYRDKDNKETF